MCKLIDLPDELLERIFSNTSSYTDYVSLSLVNFKFNRIVKAIRKRECKLFHECFTHTKTCKIKWTKVRTKVNPVERHSHSCCRTKNYLYIFGGLSATCTSYNDLWILNLDTCTWSKPLTNGKYPVPKAAASLMNTSNDQLVLYGGYSHPYQFSLTQQVSFFNELHLFCTNTLVWTMRIPSGESPRLAGHTASILNENKMIIFGGCENALTNKTNRVFCLCLETFEWQSRVNYIQGAQPHARYGHSQITLDEERILIVGGCGGPNTLYEDVWLLNYTLDTRLDPYWMKLSVNHTIFAPSQLHCISMVRCKNYLLTFGKPKQALNNHRKCICSTNSLKKSTQNCPIHTKTMHVFTLNMRNLVNNESNGNELEWLEPVIEFNQAPTNKILYTLSKGINELILFGGMEIESQLSATSQQKQQQQQQTDGFTRNKVCNSLYILRAVND